MELKDERDGFYVDLKFFLYLNFYLNTQLKGIHDICLTV